MSKFSFDQFQFLQLKKKICILPGDVFVMGYLQKMILNCDKRPITVGGGGGLHEVTN